jgi:ParB-like chromosome segregation protein Spo0J
VRPMKKPFKDDPVCRIEWLLASELNANSWNPNVVLRAELKLIETSIVRTGWVQPILISRSGVIIDGFHRWRLAQDSKQLLKTYGGKVPCARLDVGDAEAKMLTVRINRAKGTHVAVRMAELVKQLVDDHGLPPEEIAAGIGAGLDEVDLLYQDSIFKSRNLADAPYSKAWYPAESGRKNAPAN